MPGFIIHLSIGKEYIRKHPNEIKEESEFKRGILSPDINFQTKEIEKDKSETHYGLWGKYQTVINLDKFLKDKKIDMTKDYWKGYFLHLLTDYYFYNIDFKKEYMEVVKNKDSLYYDYDCLNRNLLKKYDVKINDIEEYVNFFDTETKYLKQDKVIGFIEKLSELDINKQIEIIKKYGMEGL